MIEGGERRGNDFHNRPSARYSTQPVAVDNAFTTRQFGSTLPFFLASGRTIPHGPGRERQGRLKRQANGTFLSPGGGWVEGTGECSAVPVSRAGSDRAHTEDNHHVSTRQTVRRTAHEEASKQRRGNRSHIPVIQAFSSMHAAQFAASQSPDRDGGSYTD